MKTQEQVKKVRVYSRKNKLNLFSKNLKHLRTENKITLQALAEELGQKNASTVHGWESGRTIPEALVIANIAGLFGVSIDSLLFENLTSTKGKALNRKARPPVEILSYDGETYECCPYCNRRVDDENNDGRFCKYCGQEIEGRQLAGADVEPIESFDIDSDELW